MMNIDSFIKVGSQHNLCEDYIVIGNEKVPYIILSDGCSSSENSDIGSRLITLTAKEVLTKNYAIFNKYSATGNIIYEANTIRKFLNLNDNSLDATLILMFLYKGVYQIYMFGDGCFFYKQDNDLILRSIAYTTNAPYYISYGLDSMRKKEYMSKYGFGEVIEYLYTCSESNSEYIFSSYPNIFFFEVVPENEVSLIGIASDGIGSFINSEGEEKNPWEVINEFTSFKNTNGSFLQRRVRRAIKDYEKEGFKHYDDISIGVMLPNKEDIE